MVEQITDLISRITKTRRKAEMEDRVLDKLKFPGMRRRENEIEPARSGTYRWLLYPPSTVPSRVQDTAGSSLEPTLEASDDIMSAIMSLRKLSIENARSLAESNRETRLKGETRTRFLSWLGSGSGIFYLSGKLGSGKSTIMKFVIRDQRTMEVLKAWAGEKQLIFASFFFWNSGLVLQRSIEGLYRSILWEVLKSCPELIPTVFPRLCGYDSSDEELLLSEVEDAFARLINTSSSESKYRICFFIDGLHEFEGDHQKLANLLNEWATSCEVKICVSSRPYSEFENSFSTPPEQCLRLQEHTYQDMIQAAQGELKTVAMLSRTASDDQDHLQLIKAAVKKADGVFLWLRLAMRHLIRGISNAYSVGELSGMLLAMPDDVSAMFETMLDRILARPDRVRVAITLLCLSDPNLPVNHRHSVAYFAAMDDVLDGVIGLDDLLGTSLHERYPRDKMGQRFAITEARLKGRCEDFIQIRGTSLDDVPLAMRRYAEFVHQDVRGFLAQDHVLQKLYKVAGCPPSKVAGLHRYLGLVLLGTVPELGTSSAWVDDLVDEFLDSETVTVPELELLISLLTKNRTKDYSSKTGTSRDTQNDSTRGMGRSRRYCTILAVKDIILDKHAEEKIYYGKSKLADPLSLALEFISAAAFYQHEEFVLRMVTPMPTVLSLNRHTSVLLSASLGGAAVHITFFSRPKGQDTLSCVPRRRHFLGFNSSCVAGLLFPTTAKELGPDPLPDQSLDRHAYDDSGPGRRKLRRGPPVVADPFYLTRALLQRGADPNAKLVRFFELPAWPGSHWTPWTATLLGLAGVMRKGALSGGTCGSTSCTNPTKKPVPVWRIGPGVYASLKPEAHIPTLWGDDEEEENREESTISTTVSTSTATTTPATANNTNNTTSSNKASNCAKSNAGGSNAWYYLTLSQLISFLDDNDDDNNNNNNSSSSSSHSKKKTVTDLLYAKTPWAVSRWVGQAAASLGFGRRNNGNAASSGSTLQRTNPKQGTVGGASVSSSKGKSKSKSNVDDGNGGSGGCGCSGCSRGTACSRDSGAKVKVSKLELVELGDAYFFVSMIVSEQELGRVRVPKGARAQLLPTDLIPI